MGRQTPENTGSKEGKHSETQVRRLVSRLGGEEPCPQGNLEGFHLTETRAEKKTGVKKIFLINTKMKGNFLKIKKQKCKERLSSA